VPAAVRLTTAIGGWDPAPRQAGVGEAWDGLLSVVLFLVVAVVWLLLIPWGRRR
jgi:hypothetical protein